MKEPPFDLYWFIQGVDAGTEGVQEVLRDELWPHCKFCGSSHVVRNGTRRGTQYWLCKPCGRGFVDNDALPKGRFSIDDTASALYQYFTGSSLNDIRGYLEQQSNVRPSDSAIYAWVVRFGKIASDEAKNYKPNVGDVWIADETVLRIGGKKYWLWDIIDADTRFLLATHLSLTRGAKDARRLMELAAKRAGKAPETVITDKLASYIDGVELTWGSDTKHIRSGPFGEDSTSLIERWHGTLKDRTKVMRGMKTPETARVLLDGWLVYYNFFRPHESLKEKTPAEKAGIRFPWQNWLDVVKSQSPIAQREGPTNHIPMQSYRSRTTKPQRSRPKRKPKTKSKATPMAGVSAIRRRQRSG